MSATKRKLSPKDISAAKRIRNYYRDNAKKSGLAFKLSWDQFVDLLLSNCTYCGRPPTSAMGVGKHVFFYNGVDRLKNGGGYTSKTAVPCCMKCNAMKSNLSIDVFVGQIVLIYKHLVKKSTD